MPSEKAQRSAERKYLRNRPVRRRAKTLVTKAAEVIKGGSLDQAEIDVRQAVSILDSAAGKGILHPNNAARRKSRLMKKLNQLKAAPPVEQAPSGPALSTRRASSTQRSTRSASSTPRKTRRTTSSTSSS